MIPWWQRWYDNALCFLLTLRTHRLCESGPATDLCMICNKTVLRGGLARAGKAYDRKVARMSVEAGRAARAETQTALRMRQRAQ